jgi:hypothetical protein
MSDAGVDVAPQTMPKVWRSATWFGDLVRRLGLATWFGDLYLATEIRRLSITSWRLTDR